MIKIRNLKQFEDCDMAFEFNVNELNIIIESYAPNSDIYGPYNKYVLLYGLNGNYGSIGLSREKGSMIYNGLYSISEYGKRNYYVGNYAIHINSENYKKMKKGLYFELNKIIKELNVEQLKKIKESEGK